MAGAKRPGCGGKAAATASAASGIWVETRFSRVLDGGRSLSPPHQMPTIASGGPAPGPSLVSG